MVALANKIALVTGGSSGIGAATARRLAAAGAHVIVLARRAVGDFESIRADVARPAELAAAFATIGERHGRLDIVVAAAGVSHAPPLAELDLAAYDAIMDVNCRGATFTLVHALPLLAPGASVVLVGSVGGRKGQPGDALYAASKAFIRGLVRSAGTDPVLLARQIRVNAVAPGPIDTPLTHEATSNPEVRAYVEQQLVPMKRWGTAEEVAAAILFLASPASSFTTGAELTVDGGMAHA